MPALLRALPSLSSASFRPVLDVPRRESQVILRPGGFLDEGLKVSRGWSVYSPMPHADLRFLEAEIARQDVAGNRAAAARARLALGCALLAHEDPVGREILEDVGAWFEEMGDEPAVRAIDSALREAEGLIEESPASFQASRRKSVPPMRVA